MRNRLREVWPIAVPSEAISCHSVLCYVVAVDVGRWDRG